MTIFRKSRTKQLEKKAKKELKASGEYGKKTEVTQEKVSGGVRRSYNKAVRKQNKAIAKGWEKPGTEKMVKMKRGTMGTEEKTVKMSRSERKAQVANKAKADYMARRQQVADKKAAAASKKAAELKKTEQVDATARHEERLAGAIKKSDETAAATKKWEASGGFSKAKVKSGEYSKTLTMSEITPYNKKMRVAGFKKAKKENPKGGTFTYQGFDSKGNKKTFTIKYGSDMSQANQDKIKNQ